ncbi:uncharacterized protein L969DRAFT_95699 [Mixia osmundae IAM 14324]|uniref:[RNA-polymerase]-subunit kinase n=1 Tax=Mixia osmundae (strain CBS 9802 / IAM 14324 / JCM 22182 / KY 12970) TaxID=764103 RepID=G7EAC6_MIXOS|nr:uncharacterized protein L969DRAFT_95699 [Mixia osmundae IAM 14324]KEI37844.1 hypothetical protein L969DRAFT_95699 [Mixia osmundae IAM 14324]GAA99786.1 hypothetical protein E5Q_06489 [Mixia osmundae IAM 14324]
MEAAAADNARIMSMYTKDKRVGEGTYATVFEGRQLSTGRRIAIKKIKAGQFKDGLDMSALREVKYLRELRHPNVIELLDVFSSKANLNLVLEYLNADLEMIIKDRSLVFQSGDIKSWMLMTMKGLEFCHRNFVLHRDMKPNNLLISSEGVLKIADFGLARDYAEPGRPMTSQVVTRWYRAPELLFGSKAYGDAVDNWAAGCIFAELMLRTPYLPGDNDFDQLSKIFHALGTPTEDDWPGVKLLADFVPFNPLKKSSLADLFTAASGEAIDLLTKLLTLNPTKRISARKSLRHPFFSSMPRPTHPEKLPRPAGVLQPRAIPPEELNGADPVSLRKRKAGRDDLESGQLGRGFVGDDRLKKVAKKLEYA